MNPRLRTRRLLALAALVASVLLALPRFLTYTPYARLGVQFEYEEGSGLARVQRVVGPPAQGLLEKGDLLTVVDGKPATRETFRELRLAGGLPRGPIEVVFERNGAVLGATLPPVRLSVWQRVRLYTFPLAAVIAVPLIAFLLVWRRPDLTAAWVFLGYAALQALSVVWDIFRFPQGPPGPAFKVYLAIYGALTWWFAASFLHFMTVFPRARWKPGRPWRSAWFWLVVAAYATPPVMWLLGHRPTSTDDHWLTWFQSIAMPLGTLSLVDRYARPGREQVRPKLSERVLALVVALTLLLATATWIVSEDPRLPALFALPLVRVVFYWIQIAFLVSPLLIAFLIANDPAFDPRRILANSLPYALLSGVLAALYLAIVVVSQRMFAAATGEEAVVFNVVAALIVAFAFAPLRTRTQHALDRLYGRDPLALRAALDQAGHELLAALDRDQLRVSVEGGLARGLKRRVALDWPAHGPPRLAAGEEVPEHAASAVENLLLQAGIRLENLALQEQHAAAEREAVEQRAAATRAELRALLAQVQPHFLFNALNALSYLIETEPPAAQRFTERLADMLRYTVEAGNRPAALLSEEIAFVEDYLGVARERYETPLEFEYRGPRELLSLPVPPLLLQPLVENSLKHGCAPEAAALHLSLEGRREDGFVELLFTDDGIATGNGGPGLGVGLTNLEQRLRRFAGAGALMEAGARRDAAGAEARGFAVRLRWQLSPGAAEGAIEGATT